MDAQGEDLDNMDAPRSTIGRFVFLKNRHFLTQRCFFLGCGFHSFYWTLRVIHQMLGQLLSDLWPKIATQVEITLLGYIIFRGADLGEVWDPDDPFFRVRWLGCKASCPVRLYTFYTSRCLGWTRCGQNMCFSLSMLNDSRGTPYPAVSANPSSEHL